MRPYTVSLALPSPLYAPFYLAKQERLRTIFKHVRFEYQASEDSNKHDPLFNDLLSETSNDRQRVMSVGDPFRLRHKNVAEDWDDPLILSVLLKRMCYWIINGESQYSANNNDKYPDHFERLIVHPKRMTGYYLSFYDTYIEQGATDKRNFLYTNVSPGNEDSWYNYWSKRKDPTGSAKPLAFLTTDPILVRTRSTEQAVKRWFDKDDKYANQIMTAIITGRDIYEKQNAIIEEILDGVQAAIYHIVGSPEWAAKALTRYADSRMQFAKYNTKDIEIALKSIVNESSGAYNLDLKAPVPQGWIEKSILLREAVEAKHPDDADLKVYLPKQQFLNFFARTGVEDSKTASPSYALDLYKIFDKVVDDHDKDTDAPSSYPWTIMRLFAVFLLALAFYIFWSANRLAHPIVIDQNDMWLMITLSIAAFGLVIRDLYHLQQSAETSGVIGVLFGSTLSIFSLAVFVLATFPDYQDIPKIVLGYFTALFLRSLVFLKDAGIWRKFKYWSDSCIQKHRVKKLVKNATIYDVA